MKKIISIILSAVMLLSAVITVNAASFKDVKSSDWYYSSVNYVADKGIMQGTSSTKFSPKTSLTRAMGVTLLYRVAGSPSVSGVNIPFNDVKNGTWYTDAVKWAYKNGVVTGKSSTFFDTNGNITRAEFATILNRYATSQNYKLPSKRADFVTDVGQIPSWAFGAVTVMYKAEIINGRNDGSFDSNSKITRAEAAAMIERFMKAPKDGSSNNTNTETQPPIENPEVPTTGKLVVKEKKYDYNDVNVMILNVENQTSKDLDITISAKYLDASGKIIYAENRMIEGFPANYQNYVVLQPGIKFDKFTYEVKTSSYSGEAYMKYIKTGSKAINVRVEPSIKDTNKGVQNPRTDIWAKFSVVTTYSSDLYYEANFALLDNKGMLIALNSFNTKATLSSDPQKHDGYEDKSFTLNTLYKDYVMPDSLKSDVVGLVCITKVTNSMEDLYR